MYDAAKPQLLGSVAIDIDPANFQPEIFDERTAPEKDLETVQLSYP